MRSIPILSFVLAPMLTGCGTSADQTSCSSSLQLAATPDLLAYRYISQTSCSAFFSIQSGAASVFVTPPLNAKGSTASLILSDGSEIKIHDSERHREPTIGLPREEPDIQIQLRFANPILVDPELIPEVIVVQFILETT